MTAPRSMPLGELTDVIGPERVIGLPVGEVRSLAYDSRNGEGGSLFFAVPGVHVDGHDFARQAVAAGALAVVVERELPEVGVPQLVVGRSRAALADAAAAWFDHPSHKLVKRNARVTRELGHERGLGHARLCVDLETDQSLRPLEAVVEAEIRPTYAAAAERLVRPQR